jgi:hypothetical protein
MTRLNTLTSARCSLQVQLILFQPSVAVGKMREAALSRDAMTSFAGRGIACFGSARMPSGSLCRRCSAVFGRLWVSVPMRCPVHIPAEPPGAIRIVLYAPHLSHTINRSTTRGFYAESVRPYSWKSLRWHSVDNSLGNLTATATPRRMRVVGSAATERRAFSSRRKRCLKRQWPKMHPRQSGIQLSSPAQGRTPE